MSEPSAGRVPALRAVGAARLHAAVSSAIALGAAMILATVRVPQAVALDMLTPGSDAEACSSMLVPGARRGCAALDEAARTDITAPVRRAASAAAAPASATGSADSAESSIEAAIDAYLAGYGKPPRAAVRALLDPSDANVAALLAEQVRQEARAAQVAARLTRLRQWQGLPGVSAETADPRAVPTGMGGSGATP